ncbi:MAG: phenylpyruvate tautomerase MIF-related protein, partial [Mariprofundaceae bacterium]|nr:phenylpyruvate tautomerase MIF-related protein [Mariprofundaceae bacterium]
HLESIAHMLFAGSVAPAAYVQLKSLGLPAEKTSDFSATLCALLGDVLDVEAARIYIEFSAPERHMWGWNNTTF